ncbi:MAG: NrfD/PsrC family molybdoenzyme membrane anchor subunit [Candidatus Bipolaricaulia bacterium]
MRRIRQLEEHLRPLVRIGPGYLLGVSALLALIVWAVYVYVSQQLRYGLGVTGMNTPTYWGLYIVNFVFFVGLSAGGVIVASLVHAFNIEKFRSVARIAELLAISCLLLAVLFITLDLGRPDRIFNLLRYGRLNSPLLWDVIVISAYLIASMAYGYFGTRLDLVKCMKLFPKRRWLYRVLALGYTDDSPQAVARDHKILKTLAVIALPLAVALHSVTAWILGLVKAKPGWHSALLGPLFVVSATVSGLALVILTVAFVKRILKLPIKEELLEDLGKLLALAIPVLGYFLFAELLTVTFAAEPTKIAIFEEMIVGKWAPIFWFNLVIGLIVPLVILLKPSARLIVAGGAVAALLVIPISSLVPLPSLLGRFFPVIALVPSWVEYSLVWMTLLVIALVILAHPRWAASTRVGIAAFLVVLGVLAERFNIVIPPELHPLLPYPHGVYSPTWVEYAIVGGVYAVGVLFFVVCSKLFPLVELEEHKDG